MSCEAYRETLSDALLRGETTLGVALAGHLQTCGVCRDFCEAQRQLLGAIDSGVRATVNEEVPSSLLPGVRARMEAVPMASGWPRFLWASVFVVASLILLATFALQRKGNSQVEIARNGETNLTVATPTAPQKDSFRMVRRRKVGAKPVKPAESLPEVIVLPEERAAFARFVANTPLDEAETAGLGRTACPQDELPMDIALLQIETVTVNPLEAAKVE